MIRYADERDFEAMKGYDKHISESELQNAICAKRILLLYEKGGFIGWLRYNLFWDEIPFMNMLYVLEEYREQAQFFYRKNGYVDCGSLLLPGEALEIILRKDLT